MNNICIFDLDGTLVDSMPRYTQGILRILDEEGIPYEPDLIKVLTPLGYTKSAELYVTMGVPGTVETIVKRIENNLVYEYANNIPLKEGVGDYLRKRKSEGARLYVLTASPHIVTDICLQHNGVYDLFDEVWSVEDFGLSKSDVKLFHVVADTIGCSCSDIDFFDDNLTAVTNSKKAGNHVIGVCDRHSVEETAAMKAVVDQYIGSFKELL